MPFFNVTKQIIERGFAGANPARKFDLGTVTYLRTLSESQQINVPVKGSGSGSDLSPFMDGFLEDLGGGSSSSFLDGYVEDLEAGG